MKKQLLTSLIALSLSSTAMAVNPASLLGNNTANNAKFDNLKLVQQEYQNLIRSQAREEARIARLEYRLKRAEKKLAKAQFNVHKIRAELMLSREIHQTQQAELKRAGARLDRAWQAAYGASTYRVAGKAK